MLGAETARTRGYLSALRDSDLLPSDLVLLGRADGAGKFNIGQLARSAGVRVAWVDANDVNDPAVAKAVVALSQPYVIFSGAAGAIVRKPLFATGKKFIHIHPGRLPDYRGSTTIYYSLLAENKVEATALLLNEDIDAGPIIGRAVFEPPADRRMIDADYDPNIRASLLVSVLRDFVQRGEFEAIDQPADVGETFFIIHPVLKHLAILAS